MDTTAQSSAIMRQMLDPIADHLGPETAPLFANLQATPAMIARLEVLGAKCNEGELTPEERAEYQTYVQVGDLFSILRAKAKQALAKTT